MNAFISPSVESLVRKRAGGQCEWLWKPGYWDDVVRCSTSGKHLRCLKTNIDNFNKDVQLLCTAHYDAVLAAKLAKRKPKSKKPPPAEQIEMFD